MRTRFAAFGVLALLLGPAWAAPGEEVNLSSLVTNFELGAHFVSGSAVLYRLNREEIRLADPKSGNSELIARVSAIKALLAAKLTDKDDVTPLDYDAAKKTLKLRAGGKIWSYDLAKNSVSEAGGEPPRAEKQTEVESPDHKHKVIARNYNLYLVDKATGKETALTADGSFDRHYGQNYALMADMVEANSETPPINLAVQWSPDSKKLLTYRLSRNNAYIWHAIQQTPRDSRFPRTFTFVYPTAGAKDVPQIEPILIDVEKAIAKKKTAITTLKVPALSLLWPGDPPLWWEGDHILYEWTARGYGEVNLYEIDPVTGVATVRVHEAVKPLVTVTSSAIRSEPELGGYLNISERNGWAQLYYLPKGSDPAGGRALTSGAWEVSEILRTEKSRVLFTGNGREANSNPYNHALYSVTLDGTLKLLTPEPYDHRVTLSEDGAWFIDRMSSPALPSQTLLRSTEDGKIVARLGEADPTPLKEAGYAPVEPFEMLVEDGKTKLYGAIFRPKNFDPSKKYPVIDYVYTGPTTHNYPESYGASLGRMESTLASLGVIVTVIDGRGTSQRGQAFRLPAYQNMGEVGIDDHIAMMKAMAAKYPYMDLSRVGVYGHSAGGYDAARFILRRPDFFKAAVASAGTHDLRLDKAWWPEVTMGLADDATWDRNSNIAVAGNLKGKLLIVHGETDDNVPITASLRLHKALIDAGKLHEFVMVPNSTHHTVFQPYYWKMLLDFFQRNLVEAK
ncbi:dipeptidyl aminopeptidase/acylaminoacyl peptidase [Rhizomicrobium palustre]|uniref:Dipeptidyl aminopeptidase/acylaminoacyl peptidase n=1 Tax=Rhizomicrobium palustre TaxID=189966 RepID=A0A846N1X1_9PROT|nr:DPP IV N-terminal domain-containing protein [Rhizomicrobium palustre]NIK89489.1 dipeptidyl aminopeptidase/acylaminoacyl peptidase [Rhizomicrobium palustre]